MEEQKVRDAARIADEIATKAPEGCYTAVFNSVFHILLEPLPSTHQEKALLGLATTRELLAEISARIELGGGIGRGLDYRAAQGKENE